MDVRQLTCSNCHRGLKAQAIEQKSSKYGVISKMICPYCGKIEWSTTGNLADFPQLLYPALFFTLKSGERNITNG